MLPDARVDADGEPERRSMTKSGAMWKKEYFQFIECHGIPWESFICVLGGYQGRLQTQ